MKVLARIGAVASIAAGVAVAIVEVMRGFPSGGFHILYGVVAMVFVCVGWLIVERRPSNAIGPLLLAFGGLFAWYLPADAYLHLSGPRPAGDFAALFVSTLDAPMFIVIAMVLLLFPDGGLPSPRWRWTMVAGAIGVAMAVAGYLLDADPFPLYPEFSSPFGVSGFPGSALIYVAYGLMLVLLVAAGASLFVRWRAGDTLKRVQI
jgi:hypothetical protein